MANYTDSRLNKQFSLPDYLTSMSGSNFSYNPSGDYSWLDALIAGRDPVTGMQNDPSSSASFTWDKSGGTLTADPGDGGRVESADWRRDAAGNLVAYLAGRDYGLGTDYSIAAPYVFNQETGKYEITNPYLIEGQDRARMMNNVAAALGAAGLMAPAAAAIAGGGLGATLGGEAATGLTGWAAPGAFLGEDAVGAILAGSTVPEGFTIPAALGGGVAGPGGYSIANNAASLFGADIAGEAGIEAAISNAAGNPIYGIGPGAAAGAAAGAGAGAGAAAGGAAAGAAAGAGAGTLLSQLPDWLRVALGLGGAAASYFDARDKNGQFTGDKEIRDATFARSQNPNWYQPQFTTGLTQPQFTTAFAPVPQAGLLTGYNRMDDFPKFRRV